MFIDREQVKVLLDKRADEAKLGLLTSLLALNIGVLAFGAWFSLFLARRTMAPIEQAMEEQSRFVTDASHELRTPLTALQSMNEVALRRKKITDNDARELAANNVAEAAKLHALTSSLLGLVKSGTANAPLRPVKLQDAVSDAIAAIVAGAQAKSITVNDTVGNKTALADHDQLVQVLCILLDNAVKYSPPKSTITIAANEQGKKIQLLVRDTGSGISKTDLPHIFSRFYRSDTSRSKHAQTGYGIGLAIAKSISDSRGWDIAAKSEQGKGATFSLDLPLAKR